MSSASRTEKGGGRQISSNVVAVLSNYHFNRDGQTAKFKTCKPTDCTVGLKYSSSEFVVGGNRSTSSATDVKDAGFHFDRFGLLIPYPAFVSLFTDAAFGTYLARCKAQFQKHDEAAGGETRKSGKKKKSARRISEESEYDDDDDADGDEGRMRKPPRKK